MYAAGSAVVAAGDGFAASLTILTAGFSAHTGVDRAGEVFGLGYQDAAESLLKAAAAAVNACRKCGAIIQQGASNYSNVDAASTLGGGGGGLKSPSPPAELAAPKAPGTMGPGEPPPLLWAVVQSLVLELWPDGDVAGLRAAASCWRGFAAAAKGVQGTLNGSKALFDSQHIPEGEGIDHALGEIGSAAATIGEQCGNLAKAIDRFADQVDHAQHAIRDLLHRIGSLGDLGHDIMLIIDGDAWDEIKKIAKDINDLLHHLGQEARACEQGIRLLMQAADRQIVTCEKYARRGLVVFLGEDVGNPVATVFDSYINAHEGVLKDAVNMGLSLADLSPNWLAVDPHGVGATWTGLAKNAWKGSLFNAALNPEEFAQTRLHELKGLVHAEDWTGDRPGLGAGENLFDVATLIAPGLGEAGAAADGAGAAARGAEAEVDAAGAAGRVSGKGAEGLGGITGARGALTDITKTSGEVTKNLEGVTKDLLKVEAPASGSPVTLPGKPIEPPVESAPRPADGAPAAPQAPTAPSGGGGPREPAGAPAGGPHEPALPAPGNPHEPASIPAEGPREPVSVPAGDPHKPASLPAVGSPSVAVPTTAGERLPSALSQPFDHSLSVSPGGPSSEAARFDAYPPEPTTPASAHLAPSNGYPADVPPAGGGGHGLGEGSPLGERMPGESPHGGQPHGDGGPPDGDGHPQSDHDANSDSQAGADYVGPYPLPPPELLTPPPDGSFFWSGRTSEGVGIGPSSAGGNGSADLHAASHSGTTLEGLLDRNGVSPPKWSFDDPAADEWWSKVSETYAANTRGEVRAVIGPDLRPGNVWQTVELPRLMNNPNVTRIVIIDPETGAQSIIFER